MSDSYIIRKDFLDQEDRAMIEYNRIMSNSSNKKFDIEVLAENYAKELVQGGAIKDWQIGWMKDVYKYIYNQVASFTRTPAKHGFRFTETDLKKAIGMAREDECGGGVKYSEDEIIALTIPKEHSEIEIPKCCMCEKNDSVHRNLEFYCSRCDNDFTN